MSCEKVLYEELQPAEFVEKINEFPVAYLPLGTLEWHGLHMPFGADGIQSKGFFELLAKRIGGIVLPMLFLGPDRAEEKNGEFYYGMDNFSFKDEHPQKLEGSAYYMDEALYKSVLDNIISNLKRAGFKMVVAHGHGPSITAFTNEHDHYLEKYNMPTYTLFDLGATGDEGIMTDHAAFNETALVMGLRPDLVNLDNIKDDEIPIAIWGIDPRNTASEAVGKQIIEKNLDIVSTKISELAKDLPKANLNLDYTDVKSMMRD